MTVVRFLLYFATFCQEVVSVREKDQEVERKGKLLGVHVGQEATVRIRVPGDSNVSLELFWNHPKLSRFVLLDGKSSYIYSIALLIHSYAKTTTPGGSIWLPGCLHESLATEVLHLASKAAKGVHQKDKDYSVPPPT